MFTLLISQVATQAGAVAGQAYARQAAERKRLGLPEPTPPPPPSAEQLRREKRQDRMVFMAFACLVIFEGLLIAAPIVGIVYLLFKVLAARQGIKL